MKYEIIGHFIDVIPDDTVFVEIGSDKGEGSTRWLADLALSNGTNLFSVDIDNILNRNLHVNIDATADNTKILHQSWKNFYEKIKDPTWPEHCDSIDELPEHLQQECLDIHNWRGLEKSIRIHDKVVVSPKKSNAFTYDNHPALILVQDQGSEWCKKFATITDKKISVLYLDNFDYVSDDIDANFIARQILYYKEQHGIEMNNQNCQIEHFKQILNLTPHLHQNCVIAFDDTMQHNGCWIGKCGPAVIYLLALGFEIVYDHAKFVVLRRNGEQ